MHADRYSPDVERRYQAALAEDGALLPSYMPFACFGSANAFLVLVGPSMGGAAPNETAQAGGSNRPDGSPMRIGYYPHFNWQPARSDRWRRFAAAMLGADQYVDYLTAVLNLDWSHQPDERDVPEDRLQPGFNDFVWPAIMQIKPRIVCALTTRVWHTIAPTIQTLAVSLPTQFPSSIPVPKAPIFFAIPNARFTSMLLKSQNHPAEPFLSREHIKILGEACTWFRNHVA